MSDIPPSGIAHNGPNTDITDDARAVREAAMDLYRAMRRTNPDAWAEVDEVEDWTYWDDIVRTAQVTLAAGRAETTTATTEDMATRLAAAEAELDRLCDGGRFTMSIPAREGYDSDLLIQAALSDLRSLLATARTRPSREQLIHALRENDPDNYGGPSAAAWYYEAQADAVLALLRGEAS